MQRYTVRPGKSRYRKPRYYFRPSLLGVLDEATDDVYTGGLFAGVTTNIRKAGTDGEIWSIRLLNKNTQQISVQLGLGTNVVPAFVDSRKLDDGIVLQPNQSLKIRGPIVANQDDYLVAESDRNNVLVLVDYISYK